jgi:acetyltransferase-like isoleucine patch superfamily enzyme
MQVNPPKGLRARINARIKARVRLWVDGHQYRYFDTPGSQWMEYEYPTYPTLKILETVRTDREIPVHVGKYCAIHYSTVLIPGGMHHSDWIDTGHSYVANGEWVRAPGAIFAKGPITIGNDVFIAFEAVITSGVTIGDGAIIATRAMVGRDVEPYSIVGGNPAKHIKYRFEQPVREALLRIRWWDWAEEKVAAHHPQMHVADAEDFVAKHDPEWPEPRPCEICATA